MSDHNISDRHFPEKIYLFLTRRAGHCHARAFTTAHGRATHSPGPHEVPPRRGLAGGGGRGEHVQRYYRRSWPAICVIADLAVPKNNVAGRLNAAQRARTVKHAVETLAGWRAAESTDAAKRALMRRVLVGSILLHIIYFNIK